MYTYVILRRRSKKKKTKCKSRDDPLMHVSKNAVSLHSFTMLLAVPNITASLRAREIIFSYSTVIIEFIWACGQVKRGRWKKKPHKHTHAERNERIGEEKPMCMYGVCLNEDNKNNLKFKRERYYRLCFMKDCTHFYIFVFFFFFSFFLLISMGMYGRGGFSGHSQRWSLLFIVVTCGCPVQSIVHAIVHAIVDAAMLLSIAQHNHAVWLWLAFLPCLFWISTTRMHK